ncbi:hypothetical protein [Halopseudomonas xinjiangensis]|nr:hypothetical protein [Halopseudomonas xinjiangensis]
MLQPVVQSLVEGKPIRWNRVTELPDFVYFHHGASAIASLPIPAWPSR